MKRIVLLCLFIAKAMLVIAQSGVGYQQFSIGAGAGSTTAFGNTKTVVSKNAYNVNASFNYSPFFTLTAEGQLGSLAGGSLADYSQHVFLNNFKAFIFHADIQAGEYIDYHNSAVLNSLKNIYFGAGIGFINNDIAEIQIVKPNSGGQFYPFYPTSTNIIIPIRVGYDLKIFNAYDEPKFHLDFSYSFSTALGDGLDGYANLSPLKFYGYFSVGIKLNIGPLVLYRKPIDYTHF